MGRKLLSRAEAELTKARERVFSYRNTFDNILDLVHCLNAVSELYAEEGRLAEAISLRKESIASVAGLARSRPQEVLIQRFQWSGLCQLGDLYIRLGDHKAAEHAFRDGLLKTRSVAARFPRDSDCQFDMFSALVQLADVLDQEGEIQNAFDVYVDALGVGRTYAKLKSQSHVREQNPITFALRRIGILCENCGEWMGARDAYSEAVAITKKESAAYPHDLQCRFELSQDLSQLAGVLSNLGQYEESVERFELALTVLRATGNSSKHCTDCDELVGTILLQLAEVHGNYNNRAAARRTYRAAVFVAREMVKTSYAAFDSMKFLAHCLDDAAYDMLEDQAYEEGVQVLRELVTLSRRLLNFEPDSTYMQHRFSGQLKMLMECESALGNEEAAYEAAAERVDFDRRLLSENGGDHVAQWRYADGLLDLCRGLKDESNSQEAKTALTLMESLEKLGKLPAHQKESLQRLRQLSEERASERIRLNGPGPDLILCVPYDYPSEFDDDVSGSCHSCNTKVRLRPHMPSEAAKICLPCVHNHWVVGDLANMPA